MRNEHIFDAIQAEIAYRTEELYKASGPIRQGGSHWWKLGRRTVAVPVPQQRRPSRDRGPRASSGPRR